MLISMRTLFCKYPISVQKTEANIIVAAVHKVKKDIQYKDRPLSSKGKLEWRVDGCLNKLSKLEVVAGKRLMLPLTEKGQK